MQIARKCNSVTSALNETVRDNIARSIASVLYPEMRDLQFIKETIIEVNSMSDEWFNQFTSKCRKFIR